MFEKDKFYLEARPDGIYLSCHTKDFKENDVYAFLKEWGIVRYDFKALRKFVKDGETCKVCGRSESLEKDARILVSLDKEKMNASVAIDPPFFTKPWPKVEDVKRTLDAHGIKIGVNDTAIQSLLARELANEPVIVATGIPPIEGKNAEIELI
ncbi:MAG: DUF342 domain-containing protein, partial [Synergistaceae bacterium]|nr:DUF342 domain-containing protein [Synergistaceae bacterium]